MRKRILEEPSFFKRRTLVFISLLIIVIIAGITIGITGAFFADEEKSANNIVQAGTFDIDGEGTFVKTYIFTGIYPGKDAEEINFTLKNKGSLPMRVWMTIKNVSNEENGISDSEQDWYDNDINGGPKNDVDSAMVYALDVDGNLALEQEAGITVSQIKDYYIGLVKLDIGITPPSYGILESGESIIVNQKFYLPVATENWAQSDIMSFEIEVLARQISAQEPIKQLSFIQNKDTGDDWALIRDERIGVLKYDSLAETFNYDFIGRGLTVGEEYNLIYYPDPWGNSKTVTVLSDIMVADGKGEVNNTGQSLDAGDLPIINDDNYLYGAKIWLVRSDQLSNTNIGSSGALSWGDQANWLFDNWPGLIRYTQSTDGNPSQSQTVYFNDLNASPQFGKSPYDDYDYDLANVSFTYDTPALSKLSGTITATDLKPNMTYQVKFIGKPTCQYGSSGNDSASEYIGYKGRWTCLDCSCSGASCNRTDAQYETNKAKLDTDSSKECIAGYLAWDYITANDFGDVTKTIKTTNSYHVLFCSGGTCGQMSNGQLSIQDPYPTCAPNDVNGQIERFSCNGLVLDDGDYDLDMVLTEESFHQNTYGVWTTVMGTDINFEIE